MAQVAVREYDAKKMFAEYSHTSYTGFLIQNNEDLKSFEKNTEIHTWVIKPDQLFGKRGKYGLIGVNLETNEIRSWWENHFKKEVTLSTQSGKLDTFLIEPFIQHTEEYYVAIKTDRECDEIFFSEKWGIEVEENWDSIQSIQIPLASENTNIDLWSLNIQNTENKEKIIQFIKTLYAFFIKCGYTYLEVNPFTFDSSWNIVCLDMVARVDTCEGFKQKEYWKTLEFTNPFWAEKSEAEKYIDELDAATGASLKFRILNKDGRIWLLTSGGWASVIIADTIADMGYADEVGNYGECSGNPDRENTKAYTLTLLDTMLTNERKWKYLIIAWAIANFTHIDKTFSGIIDAFEEKIDDMLHQEVKILVRRGGINDTNWLQMMKDACERLGLPCEIANGNIYMTDILQSIHFS